MRPLETPTARILTGTLKGKKIALPHDDAVRPTRERVRAAVFNMLESRIHFAGQRALDLCCGSGAWGLEAFSRGAAPVTLVDSDTKSAARNVDALALAGKVEVVEADVRRYVPAEKATLVLADPPYDSDILQGLLERAEVLCISGAVWAMEYGTGKAPTLPQAFESISVKGHGASEILLARYNG